MSDFGLGIVVGVSVSAFAFALLGWMWFHFAPFDPHGIKAYRKRQQRKASLAAQLKPK